jgi:hypothetical protein
MTALRNRYKTTTAAIISFSRFIFLRMLMSVGTAQTKETGHLVNDRYRVNKHKKIGVLQETSFVRRSLIFQDEADARVDEWVAAPAYYDIMQSAISAKNNTGRPSQAMRLRRLTRSG